MNPENCGPHIQAHHSHLWRKTMFVEPRVPDTELPHKQLNQYAMATNSSWRFRNNAIRTNSSHLCNSRSIRRNKSKVEDILQEENKGTHRTKTLLKSLMIDKDALEKSKMLIQGMAKLKEMDLLKGRDLNEVKFPGIIKNQHIYNDYHERVTNPGFSRNYQGKHFTK